MTDEQRLEFAHRIVDCMVPGCNDLALQAIREIEAAAFEACALAAEAEKVDAESTGTESDAAYNRACDDCAAAIRARGAEGKETQ